jgi:enoyl-CoA hydratase
MRSEPATISLSRDGGVSVLNLNRPTALNARDGQRAGELCAAVDELFNDTDVCAALITGEGRSFSASADSPPGSRGLDSCGHRP